ncbi:MAG: GTPase [Planctomycetes bacterium]|nr:GTPase [Planctomycetota bacterium]
MRKKVLIMGAAGKDFHTFNTIYRDNPDYDVVAFTATQIPDIDNRSYPPALAGRLYPDGIPIKSERFLSSIIKEQQVNEVVFAYSDVSYDYIDVRRKKVDSAGAEFALPEPALTMIKSTKPVIAVCAVRTGAGKSQTTRRVVQILKQHNKKVGVVRHPMPYGDLTKQIVERFETLADLDKYNCTIEEREEYEPHIEKGAVVFAGVDYEKILRTVEKEADVVVWDGGNNDTPFFKPNLHITVCDPLRAGHELSYYPGKVNFEMADVLLINKMDSAAPADVESILKNARQYNPDAIIIKANSPISTTEPDAIKGKRVLVVEDGPTVTHGEMKFGAGYLAAKKFGAAEIIDPRPYARGTLIDVFKQYSGTGPVLPCVGYSPKQIKDLEATIDATPAELVVIGTPIDLSRIVRINKPNLRVTYELEELGTPNLEQLITRLLATS